MTKKYIKKPIIEVEALQYNGDNIGEVRNFAGANYTEMPSGLVVEVPGGVELLTKGGYLVKNANGTITPYSEERFNNSFELKEEKAEVQNVTVTEKVSQKRQKNAKVLQGQTTVLKSDVEDTVRVQESEG